VWATTTPIICNAAVAASTRAAVVPSGRTSVTRAHGIFAAKFPAFFHPQASIVDPLSTYFRLQSIKKERDNGQQQSSVWPERKKG
jgi:hypothetical protein